MTRLCLIAVLAFTAPCDAAGPKSAASAKEADINSIREFLASAEEKFNTNDPDIFMPIFADDAIIMGQALRDVFGQKAIRALYSGQLANATIKIKFNSAE